MKKILILLSVLLMFILTSCNKEPIQVHDSNKREEANLVINNKEPNTNHIKISPEIAKEIMDSDEEHIILDVRSLPEYNEGHIKDAIRIEYDKIKEKAETMLPDKNTLILVYCRSGNRSKQAFDSLIELGYTNVRDFGGILDWPYEIIKE